MKRSEMINLILNYFDEFYSDIMVKDLERFDVCNLLNKIEEAGMLPPPVDGLVVTKETDDGFIEIPIWKWEEE